MPTESAVAALNHPDREQLLTDAWAEHNLYCPNCWSSELKRANNEPGAFCCPDCQFRFQVKSQKLPFDDSVVAGDYDEVARVAGNGTAPGYFFMHYEPATWTVRNLLLVPLFAVPLSALSRRGARAHFVLERIPAEARIAMVTTIRSDSPGGTECIMIARPEEVRERFHRLQPGEIRSKRNAAKTL